MGIEFHRPYFLLALPVCLALIFIIDRFTGRRRKTLKRRLAASARAALVCLLTLALAGPALLLPGSQAATWALVDLSSSVSGRKASVEGMLREGLAAAEDDLQVGAITFGKDAMVDSPLASGRDGLPLDTQPDSSATDIGRALAMALALLPEDAAGRIALLSDGKDNVGGVASQFAALQARGIAVDVLPIESGARADAQVTSVIPPDQVYQNEKFDVVIRVDSLIDTTGTLVLYANRQPVDTREITLRRGENTFVFQDTARQSGVVTYEAQLVANGDENPRNNRLGAYMDVRGAPHVLVVGDGEELAPMLQAAGMQTETILPGQLPHDAEALRQYHAVALVNVNDDDLRAEAIEALDDYVNKLGRGLAVFGGDDSYAIGGWRGSALEDMLPVTMDVDNRLQMPSLSLMLVIDKSGSMSEGRYGITRLDMAVEAAMRSTEVLTARDNVGVIAFDTDAKWVVPMQQVEDVGAIQEMIGTIRPGGGTAFYSALAQALGALVDSDSQLKHVIFLTDGEAGDSGYESLVLQMTQNDITLTTVAVGDGANTTLLRRLAEWGNGRSYATSAFDDIPKIFTKETFLATQAYVQNRTFYPVVWASGPLTDYVGFPPLHGYLTTTARPLATVSLATDQDEPLLAWWQYGAGRVLAWASDTRGAWTADLLQWEQASEFFAGMVLHVLPAEEGEGELTLTREGETLRMRYTVPENENGLTTSARVFAPDGAQTEVSLSAAAPGVYEGVVPAGEEGAYAVRVEQHEGGALMRTLESGVTVGYSSEYDLRAADGLSLLARIAEETGGRLLENPAELFAERGTQTRARRDITTPLLIAALILFVLDAAQRRLSWERWLPQKTANDAKPAKAGKDTPKPAKKDTSKPGKEEAPPPPPPTETAEKLLAGRKKKLL